MLAGKLNSIVGEITLPSGEVVKAYDFLTCQSEECKQMLRQKDIEEYNEKSCPLTVKNRWFFAWILDKNLPFKKEQTFRGFAGRMKREGISCVEDRMLNIIIDDGLSSLVHNPKLLFTADTVATVYKGNIIKNLIMDCQSYTKYRPNETTGGIFVSWRRKEELPTGA